MNVKIEASDVVDPFDDGISDLNCYPFDTADQKRIVHNAIKLMGIGRVEVRFDGSGDGGQIESVKFFNHDGQEMDDSKFATLTTTLPPVTLFDAKKREWVTSDLSQKEAERTLGKIIEDAFWAADGNNNLDWVNNDGGYGIMSGKFNTTTNEIKWQMRVSLRITSTEDHEINL